MSNLAQYRERLAELCDVTIYSGVEHWHPDEDVAQAVQCLEALGKHADITYQWANDPSDRWVVAIGGRSYWESTLARAIVSAIAKALSWPSTDKDETR